MSDSVGKVLFEGFLTKDNAQKVALLIKDTFSGWIYDVQADRRIYQNQRFGDILVRPMINDIGVYLKFDPMHTDEHPGWFAGCVMTTQKTEISITDQKICIAFVDFDQKVVKWELTKSYRYAASQITPPQQSASDFQSGASWLKAMLEKE